MSQRIQYQTFQHWANGLLSERAEKQTRMTQTRTHFLILFHWINGDLSLVKDVCACLCVYTWLQNKDVSSMRMIDRAESHIDRCIHSKNNYN